MSSEAIEAARRFLAYPERYNGGTKLRKFGYFALGGMRIALKHAALSAGIAYPISPLEFGTATAPTIDEVRALVKALERDVLPYRPTADRTRSLHAFVRASVLAHTGPRVGELALLQPQDVRLQERV